MRRNFSRKWALFFETIAPLNIIISTDLPLSRLKLFLKHSMLLSLMKAKLLSMSFLANSLNLLILLNASVSLFVPSSSLVAPDKFEAPKLDKSKAKKRFKTYERFINIRVAQKCLLHKDHYTISYRIKIEFSEIVWLSSGFHHNHGFRIYALMQGYIEKKCSK